MTKTNAADVAPKLYQLLSPLSPDERKRAIQATMVLFGEEIPAVPGAPAGGDRTTASRGGASTPMAFFQQKNPSNKGETLAVAARYREVHQNADTHSKDDLKKVITDARRNFDNRNFARDIKNARRQAGFFNLGTKRDANQLSYYGQQYVDALPDRDAAAKLKRPKIGRGKKAAKGRS